MATDIFRFWSKLSPEDRIHPDDEPILSRVDHGFDLRCIAGCFYGPLRKASVVLLYLSPGLSDSDPENAMLPEYREFHARTRTGRGPLPGPEKYLLPWHEWCIKRVKPFVDGAFRWRELRSKVAILNIAAYHSERFNDYPLLAALPSSRVSLEWAQNELFPQAEAGERVVVCLRSARYWGLKEGARYGQSLFAPPVTRGSMNHGDMREEAIRAVQGKLGIQPAPIPKPKGGAAFTPIDKATARQLRGSGLTFAPTDKVAWVQTPCPKRAGSRGARWYAYYEPGVTVGELLKKGVIMADIRWNVGHGLVKFVP